MADVRLCVPCSNGRCYRCIGETANGPDTCACKCRGRLREAECIARTWAEAKSQTLAEVRRAVEGIAGLTATVSAYSSWSETDEKPVHYPELEGVCFIRRSDILAALTALQNKDTNTHTVGSEPSVGGGAK